MSAVTFPSTWRAELGRMADQCPVVSGPNVLVTEGVTLRAFARETGAQSWSVVRAGMIQPVVAVDGGCVVAVAEPEGHRVEMFDHHGKVVWELAGRWDVWPQGLVGAGATFLLAGKHSDSDDSRLAERSVRDGSVIRSVSGTSRPGIIRIDGGWAWIASATDELHVWNADGDRVVATGELQALAWANDRLFADGGGVVRAFVHDGIAWERPGGKTQQLAADADGVVCGHMDRDGLWICAYALDGGARWKAGPFPNGYPTLALWGDLVVVSGLYLGQRGAVAIVDRQDGRVVHLEMGSWCGPLGPMMLDPDVAFVPGTRDVTRRDRRTWRRIEDAWDPAYLVAVAAQLSIGNAGPDQAVTDHLAREIAALTASGATVSELVRDVRIPDPDLDLDSLRDAVASYRAVGREVWDPHVDAVAWMFCSADWPLWVLDVGAEDRSERGVELVMFDGEHAYPQWALRGRVAEYPQLRYLSLRGNGLTDAIGIDLAALPRLAYLDLSENQLERVPAEVRACRSLTHLVLRGNQLATVAPEHLPSSLRWLDVAQNQLSDAEIARLREALPDCKVISYAQRG